MYLPMACQETRHPSMTLQFGLPAKPERAYFLKREERAWLADRQHREQEIRRKYNPDSGGTLREFLS